MPLATTEPLPQVKPALGTGGPGIGDAGRGGDGRGPEDSGGHGHGRRVPRRAYYTGILVGLAPIMMLFAALASSYIVRQGLSNDWIKLQLPGMIWVNTVLLVSSSIALELARRKLKRQSLPGFTNWWKIGTLLGLGFVVGQVAIWWQLREQGVYFSDNPSHSFFYLLTVAHAVHVLGGVAALLYVWTGSAKMKVTGGSCLRVDLSSVYWHFMDFIWLFLLGLFLLGR